ncbi:MAG: penicillin-binding protein 1C, partial [Bacteroidota bacterium]
MFAIFGLLPASPGIDQEFGAPVEICANSGMLAGKHCEETRMESLPEYLENTEICKYHQLLALNEAETHRVNSSCYKVADIHHKAWFVLPPVQAWYYQQYNPGFNRLPPYMEVCEGATSKQIMQLIYPRKYARIKIPLEQDGSRGRTIFEAAHQNANAMLYWHLDNNYVGLTVGTHQLGISAEKGLHTITLIDNMGNEVKQRFEVVE